MATNVPAGGVDWPWASSPQQTAVPTVRRPQVLVFPPGDHRPAEGAGGRAGLARRVGSPAGLGRVRPHRATVGGPGAHRGIGAGRRRGPSGAVVAPARERAVRPQSAGVTLTRAHRSEGAPGRSRLAEVVGAPAGHRAARPQRAAVGKPRADRDVGAGGRARLPRRVESPAGESPVGLHAAGVGRAGADRDAVMERAAAEAATAAPEPGADRARERDRARLRGARRPLRAADGADHGPGGADDLLAGGALRAARRAGLPGDPVRQPRHRPLDDDRLGGRAGERGDGAGLRPAGLPAERHGGRHGRPAGSPGDRSRACGRRLDGRDDRPAGGDRPSAADALALLDHVGHGQPALPDAALARVRDPDGEAPEDAGGVHGRGGEDARPDRLARLPDGRAPLSRRSSAAPTTAASAPAASPASCTRSTAPATGRPPCDGSTCRRWSSTAPGTRWCARAPGGRWPTRSPARG